MRMMKVAVKLCCLALLITAIAAPASAFQSDNRIAREVRHELLLLPYYTVFDLLEYKVDGGTVTLLGAVTNPTLKHDAESVVKHIEGVERVVNNIEVLPPSPMDDQIRRATYRAVYGFGGLYRYGIGSQQAIHIIVKNGHVTLAGVVDSQGDKDAAGIQAKTVSGVFSVDNLLQVAGGKGK